VRLVGYVKRNPLNRCLAGAHSRSGCSEKEKTLLPQPVLESRIIHFVVSTLYGLRCTSPHYSSRSDSFIQYSV